MPILGDRKIPKYTYTCCTHFLIYVYFVPGTDPPIVRVNASLWLICLSTEKVFLLSLTADGSENDWKNMYRTDVKPF